MSLIDEYQVIRKLSLNNHIFNQNIGKFVRLVIVGGHKFMAEPIEVRDDRYFFKLIGQGLNDHPLASHPVNQVIDIIPL